MTTVKNNNNNGNGDDDDVKRNRSIYSSNEKIYNETTFITDNNRHGQKSMTRSIRYDHDHDYNGWNKNQKGWRKYRREMRSTLPYRFIKRYSIQF
ncbi:hypothetical protein DERF_006737 [Dermatophagoides farinae]|uniref:Uncharacterized protein n=1 Tax=Dermatophagoides farinae TaxID=6954 RepID=A0A922L5C0_DERFA|nr:hypothetical protein DERF_006737 [Dermatophagoides farinae]